MKNLLKDQKGVAHLLALIILLAGLGVGVYLVQHPTFFRPKANFSPSIVAETSLTITSAQEQYRIGEEFYIKIGIRSDIDATNLVAAKIKFDPNCLEVTSAPEVNKQVFTQSVENFYDNTTGGISVVSGLSDPGFKTTPGQPQSYMIVHFKPKAACSSTNISWDFDGGTAIYRNSDNINILTRDFLRAITIATGNPSPTPSISPSSSPIPSPSIDPTLPIIESVTPLTAKPGDIIIIKGRNFLTATGTNTSNLQVWLVHDDSGVAILASVLPRPDEPKIAVPNWQENAINFKLGNHPPQSGIITVLNNSNRGNRYTERFTIIAVAPSPSPTCKPRPACLDAQPPCKLPETSDMCPPAKRGSGDGNGDGKIDLIDMSVLLTDFNKRNNFRQGIDMNGDGVINTFDFALLRKVLSQLGVVKS